jgi:hypothetical protein
VSERERQHADDLARAERIGADFGLGAVTMATRYTQLRSFRICLSGALLGCAGLITGLAFGSADVVLSVADEVAVSVISAGAVLLGGQLIRVGLRPRAVRRLFWYSGGLAQQDLDEPEPRVLHWDEVDSVTPVFDYELGRVGSCQLRGGAGTEIAVSPGYARAAGLDLAAEADRVLADRIVPALIGAYDAGQPVVAGRWRVDRAGLTRVRGNGREVLTAWRDVRAIEYRRGGELVLAGGERRRRTIGLSGVPNGMFVGRLIEYAAGQNGIPVAGGGLGGSAGKLAGGPG